MTTTDPGARQPEATHPLLRTPTEVGQRLIDATIEVIDATGETSVRVQEIVAAVGVQVPVLYRNFGSREGLVQAAQAHRLRRDRATGIGTFAAGVDAAGSAEEFRELLDALLRELSSPARAEVRWKRINAVGSTYGRPELAVAVAHLLQETLEELSAPLHLAHRRGWTRADLDVDAFAAWFAGQLLGRVLIELGSSPVDGDAWNEISADAVRHALFG